MNRRDPKVDLASFRKEGYALLPHKYSREQCDEMKKEIDLMIAVAEKEKTDNKWTMGPSPISGKVKQYKLFSRLVTSDEKKEAKENPPPPSWTILRDNFIVSTTRFLVRYYFDDDRSEWLIVFVRPGGSPRCCRSMASRMMSSWMSPI